MQNIAIIMGRGIEGCGVTKFTIEQAKYFEKHGYKYTIFATSDKGWTRKTAHSLPNIEMVKLAKDDIDTVISKCNDHDIVIVNSLPPKSLKPEALANFSKLLTSITKPIVLIQHDHAMASITRNGCLEEAVDNADIIFVHSVNNGFAEWARQRIGPKATLFDEEAGTPIHFFQPGLYFDEVAEHYWNPPTQGDRDMKHHKWIGRTTSWKGYKEMFEFHNKHLKPAGHMTTFEGIERSPAYLGFKELSPFVGLIHEDAGKYDLSGAYGSDVHVFGPYVQDEMLHRIGKVSFGYQLSLLKPEYIQQSVEYTHCEIACTGTVPVFRKKYGERCIHRLYQKPLIECSNNGIVWFDEDNLEQTADEILRLSSSVNGEYEMMAYQAFDFLKTHQDADYTFVDMMEKINRELATK